MRLQSEGEVMDDETYTKLLKAIRDHSGLELDSVRDAANHGADSGFAGFTYTTDGADFYRANRDAIDEMLQEDAENYGYETVSAFVASFTRADMADWDDGRACLLSWYALETVGRYLIDRQEARA